MNVVKIKKALMEQKNLNLSGNLYCKTQTLFAYNSNKIEGSTTTLEETESIYDTGTILANEEKVIVIKDVTEIKNHFTLFKYMLDNVDEELSIDMIKKFHYILKEGTLTESEKSWFNVGEFKKLKNYVGNIETSLPDNVSSDMEDLLLWYHNLTNITLEDIIEFHVKFLEIHPFQDGNGRVGRLIMFKECLKYNIEPLVTMFHFDLPAALEKKGGWSRRESVDEFVNFAKILYENYGDRVKYWLTINEQNVLTLNGEVIGTCDLKGVDNKYKKLYQENHHMLLAQAKAMALCHEMVPGGKIGPAPNISLVYPASCKPKDVLAAQNLNAIRNWLYLDMAVFGRYNNLVWAFLEEHDATPVIEDGDMDIMASAHPDFIGFNYYSTATVEWNDGTEPAGRGDQQISGDEPGVFKAYPNPNLLRTEFGWEIDPDGFRATMREIYSRYHLPMIVTENGLGAYDKLTEDGKVHDQYRIEYLRKHIEQIKLACSEGVEMMGYCPWSAIDLVSTHEGVVKRYGFIYVNRDEFDLKDLARYKKDSFYWYKKVIASNGEDLD